MILRNRRARKVAPLGGRAEGGEEMVTLADRKQSDGKRSTHMYDDRDVDDDDFPTLVIDTHTTEGATSMEQDKQRLLRQLSRNMELYRENNPSDSETDASEHLGAAGEQLEAAGQGDALPGPVTSVFPGPHSDSSTPSSRVHSPTPSSASNSGGSTSRTTGGKLSHPQKARRKTDKILPVDGGKYICPICKAGVGSSPELTKHIRSHNNGGPVSAANACTICGKVLSSQSSLDRHMLVHSGERPFKCKFCAMSFTTNGNMHRHARIHEKEVRSEGRSSVKHSASPQPRYSSSNNHTDYSQVGFPSSVVKGGLDLPPSGSKRKLSFDHQEGLAATGSSCKRRQLSHLADTVMRPQFTILSPEGRAVKAVTPSPPHPTSRPTSLPPSLPAALPAPKTAPRSEGKQQEARSGEEHAELQCPECAMPFLCRYGLESHLQTHPNFSFTCQLCPRSFTCRQDLVMHKFQDHKCSVLYNSDKPPKSDTEDVAVGFHELDFIDFTCEKFPLIAQAWCDENVHCPSSAFHDFTCKICKKAFPCKAALRIHSNTHAPDDMTECQECEIHLTDHHSHTTHMLNHIAPKVVSRVSKTEGGADSPQDVVSKEDFLTCFGLTVSKSKAAEKEEVGDEKPAVCERRRQEEMGINEEYYPLLQRMARIQAERRQENQHAELMAFTRTPLSSRRPAATSTEHSRLDSDGGNDLADIQQILSHFGSGSSLVNMGQNLAGAYPSPHKDMTKAFNPLVMIPDQRLGVHKEGENGMKLPVMVNNGFVPIQNRPHHDDPTPAVEAGSSDTFQCKYCPEVFNNFKNYKSHTRTHLGLAPYKCSLCPYSSADKSTLIRHLRTHNGERPFQCRICDFAFTTKANCERHVRKKHMRYSKKDIDDVIGYNHYPTDTTQDVDAFGSPDTVCKYCGEDFKFFRALKHHLRTHSSCTRKPYTCRMCETGFSTKANVMRHVQKQHPDVDQHRLDDYIFTNELLAAEVAEDTKVYEGIEAMNDRSSSPALASSTPQSVYGTVEPIVISPIPFRSTPPPPGAVRNMSGRFITSPPVPATPAHYHSGETQSVADDQPLDFSMKAAHTPDPPSFSLVKLETGHMSGGHAIERRSCDEPMDLSVKPSSSSKHTTLAATREHPAPSAVPASSKHSAMRLSDLPPEVASRALPQLLLTSKLTPDYGMLRYKKEYQKYYNPTVGRLQCPYCKMLFKHGLKLQVHIRSHTNERPFSCAYCSASFTIKTNLERHLKTRHPLQPAIIPDVPAFIQDVPAADGGQDGVGEPDRQDGEAGEAPVTDVRLAELTTQTNLQGSRSPRSSYGGSDDSNCDLSSVNKILDVTNPTHFSSFFNTAASEESASEGAFPSGSPFAQYQEKTSEENSNHSGNCPEDPEEEMVSDPEGDTTPGHTNLSPEEIIKQTTEKLPIIKIRNPKNAEKSEDGSGSPAKKKRNSYADSPHKLMCPYCPRAFPWISSLNRHILTHTGQKPFKCPQCPVMFSTKSNRERHLVRKHGLNVLDPATRQMMDRPFKCHLCVFSSFSTAGNLNKHYQEKHPEEPVPEHILEEGDANNNTDTYTTECQENNQVAEASKAKRLEFGLDDEDSKDDIQDSLGHKLMDHVQSSLVVISPVATTSPLSRAVSPGPTSPGGASERQHINPERDNYNVDKITECWKCDEDFGSRKSLLRHLKDHNIDLAFKCYLCDASYDQRLQCVQHMALRHSPDWAVLREKNQIGDVDEFADCMNRIVEQFFIGNASYGKKLTEAEVARYKVQGAEDMKPESDYTQRKVYCSLCPKRFWSLQDLRRHMRSHTGERPFECDLCQKRFTLKHSMMRHRRKHTDSGAASLSASDDEASHTADLPDHTHRTAPSDKKKIEATMTRVAHTSGEKGSLSNKFNSDLLHNLLGVEDSAIDEMLNCYSADNAARVLGVQQ